MESCKKPDIDEMERNEDFEGLNKALQNNDENVRMKAAHALYYLAQTRRGNHSSILYLNKALEDSSEEVRSHAAATLSLLAQIGIGDSSSVSYLKNALGDNHWIVREYAARTLGHLAVWGIVDDSCISHLNRALQESDKGSTVRKGVTFALKELARKGVGDKSSIPHLNNTLKDIYAPIRKEVALALSALALIGIEDDSSIPLLKKALKDSDTHVRTAAKEALNNILMMQNSTILRMLNLITMHRKMDLPENPLGSAVLMIQRGQRSEAEKFLREFVSKIPSNWKPIEESSDSVKIAFWDPDEFLAYKAYQKAKNITKKVVWVTPSYSKAFYLLGFIAVERGDWDNAIKYIEYGLKLEPDHPTLLCEKAMILSRTGRHEKAYEIFMKALDSRSWVSSKLRARALRGAGVALIDLKRLNEAEELLKKSLKLEPENEVAKNELTYIEHLRSGGVPTNKYDLTSDKKEGKKEQ